VSAGIAVSMSSPVSASFLVSRAKMGDREAWDALVERYASLIWSTCRRYRLNDTDAEDVGQCVWLQLVEHVGTIRDPAALPGWLVTTTRRECARVLRTAHRDHPGEYVPDVENIAAQTSTTAEEEILAAERHAALREALTDLPPPTLPCPTPRSAAAWASPSAASAPPGPAAWTGSAATRPSPPWLRSWSSGVR